MPKNHRRKTKMGAIYSYFIPSNYKTHKLHTFQSYVDISDCNYLRSKINESSSMEECVPSFENLLKIK